MSKPFGVSPHLSWDNDKPVYSIVVPAGGGSCYRFTSSDMSLIFAWIVRHNAVVLPVE